MKFGPFGSASGRAGSGRVAGAVMRADFLFGMLATDLLNECKLGEEIPVGGSHWLRLLNHHACI